MFAGEVLSHPFSPQEVIGGRQQKVGQAGGTQRHRLYRSIREAVLGSQLQIRQDRQRHQRRGRCSHPQHGRPEGAVSQSVSSKEQQVARSHKSGGHDRHIEVVLRRQADQPERNPTEQYVAPFGTRPRFRTANSPMKNSGNHMVPRMLR